MSTPHAHAATEPSSLAGHSSDHGHAEGDFAHPLPIWMLLTVFVALTILTIITVFQASFDLGSLDVAVTMVIATIKATLVMLFFMHLAFDKPFNLIIFLSSFVFVALFIIFTLSDSSMNSYAFEPVVDEVMTTTAAP